MKKIVVLITLGIFLAVVSSVRAQTPTPKGQAVRQTIKATIESRHQERKVELDNLRKEKIRLFFARMIKRIEAAIKRLEKLIDRIQSRIDKIKASDPSKDLSNEQSRLNDAKTKLQEAKDKIQSLKGGLEDTLSSQDPKSAFKKVGEDVRSVKQDLVEVHKILVHIIGDIKGLKIGNETK